MELLNKVCYLGDDDATRAAAYLCGVMTNKGIDFDRVDSGFAPADDFLSKRYALYVLSDYAAASFKPGQLEHIVDAVKKGSGLLMLGGWESYYGRLGEYRNTPLAEILPVVMASSDDRRNYSSPSSCVPSSTRIRSSTVSHGRPLPASAASTRSKRRKARKFSSKESARKRRGFVPSGSSARLSTPPTQPSNCSNLSPSSSSTASEKDASRRSPPTSLPTGSAEWSTGAFPAFSRNFPLSSATVYLSKSGAITRSSSLNSCAGPGVCNPPLAHIAHSVKINRAPCRAAC